MNPLNASQRVRWGITAKILFSTLLITILFFILFSIYTGNTLLFLISSTIFAIFIGLLQVKFIHDWFLNDFIPFLNKLDPYTLKVIKSSLGIVRKPWSRDIILVLIIFVLAIKVFTQIIPPPTPNVVITTSKPLPSNGLYVTPMQVDGNNMNIGILGEQNQEDGPFNQFDYHNNQAESTVENLIFKENTSYDNKPYGTLIVVTALSQTVTDTGLSSNVGLDELRGAYMAQYNFNRDSSQQFKLRLLIANFGTKGAVAQTMSRLMQQIILYANSDPQHFMGTVGFPFSVSVTQALYARSNTIPVISAAAVAESFIDPLKSTPANFYTNFYRIVPPVSIESTVLANFVQNYLPPTQGQTLLFEDRDEKYSEALGSAVNEYLHINNTAYYTEGKPDSLDAGINNIIQNNYKQIFFSGFADDLNALKNKLRTNGHLPKDLRIIGGEGLYDLGSYTEGNYANLFFAINASYAQINRDTQVISLNGIPENNNCNDAPLSNSNFNSEFCLFFNTGNPLSVYGYKLASHHVLLMYDAVETFLQALPSKDSPSNGPLWQTISKNLPTVHFQGVSGMIQLATSGNNSINNPINKPTYIACTDNSGFTHAVGRYVNGSILADGIDKDGLNKCINE